MNSPGQYQHWLSLGKRLLVSSVVLLIPAILAVLYFAYSFSLGSTLQNILVYSIIGLEILLFIAGLALVLAARFLK